MSKQPPKWAEKFLTWYCNPDLLEDIQGDLYELFNRRAQKNGELNARRLFAWDVIRYFRWSNLATPTLLNYANPSIMLRNYFKISVRNLLKSKGHSIANLASLSVGLACFILIAMYVRFEISFDRYHSNADRIYRLVTFDTSGEGTAKIQGAAAPALQRNMPEIEDFARFSFTSTRLFRVNDKVVYEPEGMFADNSAFSIFSWDLRAGDRKTVLSAPRSIAISKSLSDKYFSSPEVALGSVINLDNTLEYTITGVFDDIPQNSHFTFDFLITTEDDDRGWIDSWVRTQYYTYLLLAPATDTGALLSKIPSVFEPHVAPEIIAQYVPKLQLVTDIHLHSDLFREIQANGSRSRVLFFAAVGFMVLLIAGVNFVNNLTARGFDRVKEVGVRKSLGALRSELINQFLMEAGVLVALALVVGFAISYLLLPEMNSITGVAFSTGLLFEPSFLVIILIIAILTTLAAGSYPAFYLSSIRPADLSRSPTRLSKKGTLRNGLIVLQLTISTFLIIAVVVVNRQQRFIDKADLGFTTGNIINIPLRTTENVQNYETIKNRINEHSAIVNTSASSNLLGGGDYGIPLALEGVAREDMPEFRLLVVDKDFLPTYDLEIVAGRNFTDDQLGETTTEFILNQTAVDLLGWDDPMARTAGIPNIGIDPSPIIGIAKDFHYRSLHEEIQPIAIFKNPTWFGTLSVRYEEGRFEEAFNHVESIWKETTPEFPLTLSHFDQTFTRLYDAEQRTEKIVGYASALAIFLAVMGLISLTAFNVSRRSKEFGVRKVLGADLNHITALILRQYLALTVMGVILGIPLAVWFKNQWLSNFSYKAQIGADIFILVGLVMAALVVITVAFQCIRAARTNPVKVLRSE